ncbi:acyl-CoA dehydrogenase family protein [Virgibacillus salexigens]|uniref:Acyl-CoA dehydrogenase n=2 Tax=Virgibacillus TaxID=84406 RepID=A0A024QD74_9BACI|nr:MULTISPECIES: acyl-CoA dehydrogenase family protein [Virgibacillus]MYL42582.1 acyl-CoA dehydrogenase [Virgibacillus massiliensis]GGJ73934.1 acyl-CoA dehydrogenase [Virgibacillus kapii]CDQ40463.1 Acyl-CoA dehydrogenase [Virgibacillus massiliensis]
MEFTISKKEEAFREELKTWLSENLPYGWMEGKREIPTTKEEYSKFLRDWQRTLYEGGWAGIAWPKEYGGRNATIMEEIIYHQEMVRVKAPPLINYIGIHMVGPTLIRSGSEQQKQKYIQNILTGEEVWCQGYSEPNAGSDLSAIQTNATKDGDCWIINGQKVWTSYGHLADRCFLLARTNNHPEKKHKGITAFLLDMKQSGVETKPILQMDGNQEFNELYLTDAIAHDADIIGEVDEGWKVMIELMLHERVGIGAELFSLEMRFNEMVEIAKEHHVNEKPLLEDRFVRQKMAEFYARYRGSLLNYYRNLTNTLKKGHPGPESSIDKLLVSELNKEMASFMITIQGHHGVLWKENAPVDTVWQDEFLASFGQTIGGGTSEVQRNTIGERVLGLPKDRGR